jgi:hypothetical protein
VGLRVRDHPSASVFLFPNQVESNQKALSVLAFENPRGSWFVERLGYMEVSRQDLVLLKEKE